jgi:GDP-L-fucose synthase
MKFLITGGSGMVGKAFQDILPNAIYVSSRDYDLKNFDDVRQMYDEFRPECVIHLAAKVGGVSANYNYLADFYFENIQINSHVLHGAYEFKVNKVVSLLSTCIYPDQATYPLTEDQIHNGIPHYSNYAYAHAKRMLDVQSRAYRDQYGCNFITAVPNNLFGEYDNFDLEDSHAIAAIIRKIYEGKINNRDVTLWGDGTPLREFTYSGDIANTILFLTKNYNGRHPINIGNTHEVSIKEVAEVVSEIIGFEGDIIWDTTKLKGQHRKPSDNSKLLSLGWDINSYTPFRSALTRVCQWFIMNYPDIRGVK